MKHIYFARHGESEGNLKQIVGGKDFHLTDAGKLQAAQLAERVMNLEIEELMVSDFLRAQETIAPLAEALKLQPAIHSAFGEMLEPSSFFGLAEDDEQVLEFRRERNANLENVDWSYADGETLHDVCKRVESAKNIMIDSTADSIFVLSHAFFIRIFTAAILLDSASPAQEMHSIAKTLKMSNTGISYFTYDEGDWRLIVHNDHAHFAE